MIYIKPTGGLCNYLRVIFSWLLKARQKQEHLTVIWTKTTACNGYYDDIFEPVKDMTVVRWTTKPLTYEGCNPCGDYSLVRELIPKVSLCQSPQAAIHVRGTDFGKPDYELFERFIEQHEGGKIFLSTDDVVTQRHFMTKYPDRILFTEQIKDTSSLRHTSLKTAVHDLYTCVRAHSFLGTQKSSFTEMIELLRC